MFTTAAMPPACTTRAGLPGPESHQAQPPRGAAGRGACPPPANGGLLERSINTGPPTLHLRRCSASAPDQRGRDLRLSRFQQTTANDLQLWKLLKGREDEP